MPDGRLIWITGRSGQLASALAMAAGRRERDIFHLGRPEFDFNTPDALIPALTALRDRTGRPAAVINCAAYTAVDAAETHAEEAHRINAEAPARLAGFCADAGIPVLHVSTDYVFGGEPGRAWREDNATAPVNVYGASKLAGEDAIRASGARSLILRTSGVFSARGRNFLKTMLQLAATRDLVSVVDDQLTAPTPADAIADCLMDLVDRWAAAGAASALYHYCGDTTLSWAEFAERIFERSAAQGGASCIVDRITTAAFAAPAPRPVNSSLDGTALREDFGIAPAGLDAGIDRALRALRETPSH